MAALLVAVLGLSIGSARAHETRPAIVDLILAPGGGLAVEVYANAEALVSGIGPEHDDTDNAPEAERYNALRALSADAMAGQFRDFAPRFVQGIDLMAGETPVPLAFSGVEVAPEEDLDRARQSRITLQGGAAIPSSASALSWTFDPVFGASVLRLTREGSDEILHSAYAAPGTTLVIPIAENAPPQSTWAVFRDYIPVGFAHIIPKGLDHILFVVGLFLLSARLGPLLWQVTTFTVAHSITLALAMLGYVTVSPAIVEPLIAASIAFIALENIFATGLSRWRLGTVFAFGLLHGLGFAGVLSEIGLPREQFIAGLIGFNIGVEVGQLAVIALCFVLVGYWFSGREWYRRVITIPASLAIAAVALYWVAERTGMIA